MPCHEAADLGPPNGRPLPTARRSPPRRRPLPAAAGPHHEACREREIWPQEIGALAVLDCGLAGPGGRVRVEAVREVIAARLRLVPRFRQLLYVPPPGLGRPLWVEALAFDLADHVRAVPAPGDEAALLRAAEQLRRVRLDRSRPLWQMWLLPGLPEGRFWRRAFSGCQKAEGKPCLPQTSDTRSPD
jgi:Wax ester synthase-like Acyl-CoA acyltransferase domain